MKSILKKVVGVAVAAVPALVMFSCSNGSIDDPVMPPVSDKQTEATPEFSVASGAVNSGTSVTITCATDGAKIYYTTDGNDPTAESTEYSDAISITKAVTVKAIAVKSGMNDSAVESVSYTIIHPRRLCESKGRKSYRKVKHKQLSWCVYRRAHCNLERLLYVKVRGNKSTVQGNNGRYKP